MTTRPLSYEASKFVLQYLPVKQRLTIRLQCPALRTADSVIPLAVETLQMDSLWLKFDRIAYRIASKPHDDESIRYNGADQIKVIDYNRQITRTFKLTRFGDLDARRSFLMHKLLGGRRVPVVIENFELRKNSDWEYAVEENLWLPKDLKMKVKNLEIYRFDEQVIQQLSSRIIEDPLRIFRVMKVEEGRGHLFSCPLIRNAQKLDIPIETLFNYNNFIWSFDALPAFDQKDIFMNSGRSGKTITDYFPILKMIQARLESDRVSGTNITIYASQQCKNFLMSRLRHNGLALPAIVDDVENNLVNVPCLSLPMIHRNEINIYEVPGTGTNAIMKIVVMPIGAAKLHE